MGSEYILSMLHMQTKLAIQTSGQAHICCQTQLIKGECLDLSVTVTIAIYPLPFVVVTCEQFVHQTVCLGLDCTDAFNTAEMQVAELAYIGLPMIAACKISAEFNEPIAWLQHVLQRAN